ncbi:MAG: radical SAM protein [Proteobacteria bacterium]|nr:radical SAM protein [Pseudomonadota bacterium]
MKYSNLLSHCNICPRKCGVNRLKGETGVCGVTGENVKIASFNIHHGEEPPISGYNGSGTIFFAGCNLKCVYCQNYPISQMRYGKEYSIDELAKIMLNLQSRKAHNINLVTGNHYIPQIIEAIEIARKEGLTIPIVYNTSGYDLTETLKLMENYADIYLVDMRYSDDKYAVKYSAAPNYTEINGQAITEMYRQKGELKIGKDGTAESGVIIRLLVLPEDISGTKESLKFIHDNIGTNIHLSIMDQYFPTYKAKNYPELNRKIYEREYTKVVEFANELSLTKGWTQESVLRGDYD